MSDEQYELSPALLQRINELLRELPSDDARQEALSEIMDGICPNCYGLDYGRACYCTNDE